MEEKVRSLYKIFDKERKKIEVIESDIEDLAAGART